MTMFVKLGSAIGFCAIIVCAILIYFCLYHNKSHPPASSTLRRPGKLIIDTDAGGDDAGAILLALKAEQLISGFEVIAITCSYGNTRVTNVAQNVLKILTIADRSDIPVYVGASRSLIRNYTSTNWYGEDGMGDFDFGEKIYGKIDESKHASIAMIDLARQYAGNLSVLALGPLTNIGLAITLDPNFVHNVERFYIMGGSVHGIGNVAPNVEANFQEDPESTFIVLNSTRGPPVVLFPWETSLFAEIPTKWRTEVLGSINSRRIAFLNKAESKTFTSSLWNVADVILTALMLWPELITRTLITNVTPVFDGSAQGSVLVDYTDSTGKPHNVEILDAFDVESFKQILLKMLA